MPNISFRSIPKSDYDYSLRHKIEDGLKTERVYQLGLRALSDVEPDKSTYGITPISLHRVRLVQGRLALEGALLDNDLQPSLAIALEMEGGIARLPEGQKMIMRTELESFRYDEGHIGEHGDDTILDLDIFNMLGSNQTTDMRDLVSVPVGSGSA